MNHIAQGLFERARKKLVKKLLSLCSVEEPVWVEEDSKTDLLFLCSTEYLPLSHQGRIGFHLISLKVPRFSGFLLKPDKTSDALEEALGQASEVYSGHGSVVPAVVFELDGKYFVYSSLIFEASRATDLCSFIQFRNHNRTRRIYELQRFLIASGMSTTDIE
jgi:hypothetical protein